MIDTKNIRAKMRVKIIKNNVYPTIGDMVGRVGKVMDVGDGMIYVKLDGGGRYWALPAELEEVTE